MKDAVNPNVLARRRCRIWELMEMAHEHAQATSDEKWIAKKVERQRVEAAEGALGSMDPEDRVLIEQSADRLAGSSDRISRRCALELFASLGALLDDVLGSDPERYDELEDYVRRRQVAKAKGDAKD